MSRPGTPSRQPQKDMLSATLAGSRPGTPSRSNRSRSSTPSRVVKNPADDYIKDPPNNLGLRDPREQSRTNDLIGVQGTVPAGQDPLSPEELERIKALADRLNK